MTEPRTAALTISEVERINMVSSDQAYRVNLRISAALEIVADARKPLRIGARKCACCFYAVNGHFAGQAFTEWKCALCPHTGMHSNTHVPIVCDSCSDSFGLCVECGGTLNMRRKSRFERKARKRHKAR